MRDAGLTGEEQSIARRVARGDDRKSIRADYGMSATGFEMVLQNIYRKTSTENERELAEWAVTD